MIQKEEQRLAKNISRSEQICEFFENSSKIFNEELDRFCTELSTEPMPCLEEWIKISSAEISQLKSQIMFLNYVVEHADEAK